MGDQCGWTDCGDFEGDNRRNLSSSHSPHGLVQCQTSENLEATIPFHSDECNIGVPSSDRFGLRNDERAMVEVSLGHPRVGRSEQDGLEQHSSDFTDTDSVRNYSRGKFVCEMDAGELGHCDNFHGQLTRNKDAASISTHHEIQHPLDCYRENDGCVGALCDIDVGQRLDKRIGEDD